MTPTRRAAALAVSALAAVLLPVGLATPSYAAPGCLSEPPTGLLQAPCDDEVPPETTLTGVSTVPTAAGWVATSTMTFTFSGAHTDADADAIGLECRLTGPARAHDWTTCTSPRTYSGLVDSGQPYSFAVRAVDPADQRYTYNDLATLPGDDEPGEDLDASPAGLSWGQDTAAPVAFVTPDAYDAQSPQRPVVPSRRLPIRLNSNERDARFECLLDGRTTSCTPGPWVLTGVASGDHTFTARAVDRAGTPSAWSEPFGFSVPADPRRRAGWKKQKASAAFDGSVLVSRTQGARLVLKTRKVGELRLYAPTAPSYGTVRIRVGSTGWQTVDLGRARSDRREIVVIDQFSGTRRGTVVIEVLSRGRTVKVDAVLARTNVRRGD
ncbi:hypothetical protein [Nocardioides sp. Soil777]|uniref:hypothetical protein n=1 Tax=Nocardioides sp. Soil777 TaxID=1736409 RepID=UPI000A9ABFA1|nr:hypothetical protein [Nocardioides sp. Soil777]